MKQFFLIVCFAVLGWDVSLVWGEENNISCADLGYNTTYRDCLAAKGTPLLCPFYTATNQAVICYTQSCRGYDLTDRELDSPASDGRKYREHIESISSCTVGLGNDEQTFYKVDKCKEGSLYQSGLCDVGCSLARYPYNTHQGNLAGDMRDCLDEKGAHYGYKTCNSGWVGGWDDTNDGHCTLATCSIIDYPYSYDPNLLENRGETITCKIGGNNYYKYQSSSESRKPLCTDKGYVLNNSVCSKDCEIKNCISIRKDIDNEGYEYSYNEWHCDINTANCRIGDYALIDGNRVGIIGHYPDEDDKRLLVISMSGAYKALWGALGSASLDNVPNVPNLSGAVMKNDKQGKHNTAAILAYGAKQGLSYPAFEKVNTYVSSQCKSSVCAAGEWYVGAAGEMDYLYSNRYVLRNATNVSYSYILTQNDIGTSTEYFSNSEAALGFGGPNWEGTIYFKFMKYDSIFFIPMLEIYAD